MIPATLMTDAELSRLVVRDDAGFGALATPRGALPLTAMSVDARVIGLVATVDVAQTFENTLAEPIEATYVFPLPDRAAAIRFRMEVGGRVIEGVIDERAAARQAYDDAIRAGHRAAITEEDRRRRVHAPGRQPDAARRRDRAPDPDRAARGRRRRGHVPVPAGGRAALHPRPRAARPAGRPRRRARHRRGARRLADLAAGPAARPAQPGAPRAPPGRRSRRGADRRRALEPPRGDRDRARRRPRDRGPARRAPRPRLRRAVVAGRRRGAAPG